MPGHGEQLVHEYDENGVSRMEHMKNFWSKASEDREANKAVGETELFEKTENDNSGGQSKGVSSVKGDDQEQEKETSFLSFLHNAIVGFGQNQMIYY